MRKTLKYIIGTLAAAVLLAASVVCAETIDYVYEGVSFVLDSENMTARVGNGVDTAVPTDTEGSVVIPSQITVEEQVYTVTAVSANAFKDCAGLTGSLVIPEGITEIGSCAFQGCTGLDGTLTLPSTLETIGESAFRGCVSLTGSLVIPEGVTAIGEYAFSSCESIDGTISLPSTLTSLGRAAFSNCFELTGDVAIPASVSVIPQELFYMCGKLSGLALNDGLEELGDRAFFGCAGLSGELRLPSTLLTVGEFVFDGARGFSGELSIPASLTHIASGAFSGMGTGMNLTLPEGIASIPNSAFMDFGGEGLLKLPESVRTLGESAFSGSTFNRIVLPAVIEAVGARCFAGCNQLNTLVLLGTPIYGDMVFDEITAAFTVYYPSYMSNIPTKEGLSLPESANILPLCSITVINGSITTDSFEGTGLYAPKTSINVAAKSLQKKVFTSWSAESENVALNNAKSAITNFEMPADDVILTANYRYCTVTSRVDGGGGTIYPVGETPAETGSITYSFTPDEGHVIAAVYVDGKLVEINGNKYTMKSVSTDREIYVVFAKVIVEPPVMPDEPHPPVVDPPIPETSYMTYFVVTALVVLLAAALWLIFYKQEKD